MNASALRQNTKIINSNYKSRQFINYIASKTKIKCECYADKKDYFYCYATQEKVIQVPPHHIFLLLLLYKDYEK